METVDEDDDAPANDGADAEPPADDDAEIMNPTISDVPVRRSTRSTHFEGRFEAEKNPSGYERLHEVSNPQVHVRPSAWNNRIKPQVLFAALSSGLSFASNINLKKGDVHLEYPSDLALVITHFIEDIRTKVESGNWQFMEHHLIHKGLKLFGKKAKMLATRKWTSSFGTGVLVQSTLLL